ncbi:MAG TPA: tetratricopeptide repeat protein [Gemmatimonadales bacterium]|nr:tetratricopeptide repeat protein [Gemmatimonadales bacterium]
MRTVRNLAVMPLCMLAAPLLAQSQGWAGPKCDLKPGHFLVNGGLLHLQNASNTKFADQRTKELQDAQRVLVQAVTTGGQEKNPAAWYYLGRYYIVMNDAPGMDSAFNKAEALKPDCKNDTDFWRRYLWVPTFNAGVAAWQANNTDSAIASFRRASALLPQEPTSFKYLATLFYNAGKADSALLYFRRTAEVASKDPKFAQDRKDALYNLGRIQQSVQKLPEAQATYVEYLSLYPNDPEILAALGSVVMQRGNRDSAFTIYRQIIAKADSMGFVPLVRIGVEISQSVPDEPDTAAAGTSCRTHARTVRPPLTLARIKAQCDSVTKTMYREHAESSREAYQLAAQALDASLKLNPYYRETLLHRTNVALGLQDSTTAITMARRLLAVDPMSRTSIRMMAFSQQLAGKVDSTVHYLRIGDSTLIADVTISQFDSTEEAGGGREVKGIITNVRSAPNAPFKLVFDFVNLKGDVVTTDTVQVAAIKPSESQAFELKPKGPITAWRYRKQ